MHEIVSLRNLLHLFVAAVAVLFSVSGHSETIYENGGNVLDWVVYDSSPAGATISAVQSEGSTVIQTSGAGLSNGFSLSGLSYQSGWNNQTEFGLIWRMNFSESFLIYISIDTTLGHRYLTYTSADTDLLLQARPNSPLIHHGLGSQTLDGQWHTISRNLVQDLSDGEPENTLLSVNGFLIRGSGFLDDIALEDVSENIAPVADAGGDIDVLVNEAIVLDGSASSDPDGTITRYRWFLDDQFIGSGASVNYDPTIAGTYSVSLEVTDNQGNRHKDVITATVSNSGSTNYEDGSGASNWAVYDSSPAGATISAVQTGGATVIQTSGAGLSNGFSLSGLSYQSGWNNRAEFGLSWRMNFSESYLIYISIDTTLGHRYLTYTAANTDSLLQVRPNTPLIHHGLGSQTLNGQWHTISRDLAQDLADGEPDNTLLSVKGFLIRGSGLLDDITLEDVSENIAPVADAGGDIDVLVNEAIVLDGSASSDPDGTITQYRWLMDDQFIGSGVNIDYEPTIAGTYPVSLEVTDNQGSRSKNVITITVSSSGSTNYEDGSGASNWVVYDSSPAGATISALQSGGRQLSKPVEQGCQTDLA